MEDITNFSLADMVDSVNHIFECQQKVSELELQLSSIDSEMLMLEHMIGAFKKLCIVGEHVG